MNRNTSSEGQPARSLSGNEDDVCRRPARPGAAEGLYRSDPNVLPGGRGLVYRQAPNQTTVWEHLGLAGAEDNDRVLPPQTSGDIVARLLRSTIFSGRLMPGDKLPPERELAYRLGISRVTLRLALKNLEGAGYIVTDRGRGGGSSVNTAEGLLRCWKQWIDLHAEALEDMLEFRRTVESRIAALAARRRSAEDLRALEIAVESERDTDDRTAILRANESIHRAIARAAHSPRLSEAGNAARGELFNPVVFLAHMHASHYAMFEAIRAQDEALAAKLMFDHVEEIATAQRSVQNGGAVRS
jgi:GntR family transcriptional regulator, transcriptional repressor for pyruvate dehydrogenase complex